MSRGSAAVTVAILIVYSLLIISYTDQYYVFFIERRISPSFRIPSPAKDLYRTTTFNKRTNDAHRRCGLSKTNRINLLENIANFSLTNNPLWRYNNNSDDISYVTSALESIFYITDPKPSYEVGEEVCVRIQARDAAGRNKTVGGDYFRVRMHFPAMNASVNPNGIVDREDGTYDVYFTVRWPGRSDIDVTLVHPAEAVDVIKRSIRQLPNRLVYSGIFVSSENDDVKETTQCDVTPPTEGEFCNFSDPRAYAPWYCTKPPSLGCGDIYKICSFDNPARKKLELITTQKERKLLTWMKIPLQSSASLIASERGDGNCEQNLPLCDLNQVPRDMYAHGYFMRDVWRPFDCRYQHFQEHDIFNCLENKTFYIYGDSTGRQFKEYLSNHLTGFETTEDRDPLVGPQEIYNSLHNVTVRHAFHGLPLRTGKCSLYANTHYVFNELDKIEGGKHVVILLSLWAHFQKTSLYLYKQRILAILDSVGRLLRRSPGTTVVFKGANTRQVGDYFWTVSSTDWIAYQFEIKLRQLLADSSVKVGFLDTWDLTNAHHSEDDIHPNDVIVGTMMDRLLTHVCK